MVYKKLPVIGINCDYTKGKNTGRGQKPSWGRFQLQAPYCHAVIEAGGLPILIPPTENDELPFTYLEIVDGFLFTGGADYPPSLYGESPHPQTIPCNAVRAQSDLVLIAAALKRSIPMLGICLGTQLLNIYKGGKLIQDLNTSIPHQPVSSSEDFYHEVEILSDSLLATVLGPGRHVVNSNHHQAIHHDYVGEGLKITALAPDQTIEALEFSDGGGEFSLFVQWHPERTRDREQGFKIFNAFIQACKKPR